MEHWQQEMIIEALLALLAKKERTIKKLEERSEQSGLKTNFLLAAIVASPHHDYFGEVIEGRKAGPFELTDRIFTEWQDYFETECHYSIASGDD